MAQPGLAGADEADHGSGVRSRYQATVTTATRPGIRGAMMNSAPT